MVAVTDVGAPHGEALEPRHYVDPELIAVEQERIFERTCLSEGESAVAWFADRVRADLSEAATG